MEIRQKATTLIAIVDLQVANKVNETVLCHEITNFLILNSFFSRVAVKSQPFVKKKYFNVDTVSLLFISPFLRDHVELLKNRR